MTTPRKFRVWDGDTMHEPSMRFRIYADGTVTQEHHGFGIASEDESQYEVMWYTGLTDREETEIYEGDVIEDKYGNTGVVHWAQGGSCYEMACYRSPNRTTTEQKLTVIGNKHEDPDLLNEQAMQ